MANVFNFDHHKNKITNILLNWLQLIRKY